jgi:NDP-sugar pyrophosphorylase family protein
MSGFGERFRRAGYEVPKPLIEIEGKPIISHVVDMFPGEHTFLFICNQDHLDNPKYGMRKILESCCHSPIIMGVEPHKLGPVHAILSARDLLKEEQTIVNYCDFSCYWNFKHFLGFIETSECEGAIPAYKGFHPHSLGTTNYAYMKEKDGWVEDIQEKEPFTSNRMQEYASSGTYYFHSTRVMLDAFTYVVENNLNVGGEYYVSLAFKYLLKKSKTVAVYELQHFMQWGTPEDVLEYNMWSKIFRDLIVTTIPNSAPLGTMVIPMAGLGQRFVDEGYSLLKPLIPISGLPMVIQASRDLMTTSNQMFVVRHDMQGYQEIATVLLETYPNALIEIVDGVTDGQACTANIGLEAIRKQVPPESIGPIIFGACDNGALYDEAKLRELMLNDEIDVIVWGVKGHANAIRNPQMFGWIEVDDEDSIKSISVKTPLSNPTTDFIVTGTFIFSSAGKFSACFDRLIKRDGRVNGEFYLDSLVNDAIELGLNCRLFEIDHYLGWGTPADLKTFE